MTAFLKIDRCKACHQERAWEWVATIPVDGKPLAGTGVWRSQLTGGLCPTCIAALEGNRQKEQQAQALHEALVQLLGGEKPYREFTFERYEATAGNRLAFERARQFNPSIDNLYLWGACGVGKTHLAYAVARRRFEDDRSVAILRPGQLIRKVRMKDPDAEQEAIDRLVRVRVLVLDDLASGHDTTYARQVLQEILDGRDFTDRAGLVVTGKYSLSDLAQKLNDDTVPSRLAGMCQVLEIKGTDHRLTSRDAAVSGKVQ
jgi:DNA replication protein DnaC